MTTTYPLYKRMAMTINAYSNCYVSGNDEWAKKHWDYLKDLVEMLPHGSGIDGKVEIDSESTENKIIIHFEYHSMTDGYYDGWYTYKLIITPDLQNDFNMRIMGKDTPNGAKEYLYEVFEYALRQEVTR